MSVSETKPDHEPPLLVLVAGLVIVLFGVPAVIATAGAWYLALPAGVALCLVALPARSSVEGRVLRLLIGMLGAGALLLGAIALVG